MAFTKEQVKQNKETKAFENSKPNAKKDSQLDTYVTFGMNAINEIDAENIHYINESLKGINFLNEKEGEKLIPYIDISVYKDKMKAKKNSKKEGAPKKTAIADKICLTEVEPIFAKWVYQHGDFASIARDEECFMHQWVGNHWKRASNLDGKQMALGWLEEKFPDKANAKNAYSCYETAKIGLLNKRKFPERKKNEIYIPLKDYWIMLNNDGKCYLIEPSKNIGITHQINATIGKLTKKVVDDYGNEVSVEQSVVLGLDNFGDMIHLEYIPKDLPENSIWKKFLDDSQPNILNQNILQEYTGYTLLPDTRYQKAIVNVGNGSNGKGVYTEVVSYLHENVIAVLMDSLAKFGLSQLPDASLATVSETPKKNINEEMLKQLISGDRVVIEIKRMSQFTLKPFAKWIISCNAFPRIQDETDGVWRRFIIIPWDKQFLEKDKVLNLDQKIIENEMGIVLDWALQGLQRLLARGENGDSEVPEHLKLSKTKRKRSQTM